MIETENPPLQAALMLMRCSSFHSHSPFARDAEAWRGRVIRHSSLQS